ncbi:MAG: hypothetical protein V1708_05715 [Candidatus Micrarchaeota archaeon]
MRAGIGLVVIGYLIGLIVILGGAYYYVSATAKPLSNATANASLNATPAPLFPTATPFNIFGIDTPIPPAPTPQAAVKFCADGTAEGKCNEALQACRKTGDALALAADCKACGCSFGEKCNAATSGCFSGCDDGTLYRKCSNATPYYYCNENATLELNGFECGCPMGYQYDPYGAGPNSINGCTSTCRAGADCQPGK